MIALLFHGLSRLPLPLLRATARVLGDAWYHVVRIRRAVALENLARSALDPGAGERGTLVRHACRHLVLGVLELPHWLRCPQDTFFRGVEIDGATHVEAALARGRGAVVVTAHLGAWELLGPVAHRLGLPAVLVVRRPAGRWARKLLDEIRGHGGIQVIEEGPGALRAVHRALRGGAMVGFAVDQRPPHGQRSVPATFLGRPARVQRTPAAVALRCGAPLLVVVTHRAAIGRVGHGHRVVIEAPLQPHRWRGSADERVRALSCHYTGRIEQAIARHPEQWLWHHRRWVAPPASDPTDLTTALPALEAGRTG